MEEQAALHAFVHGVVQGVGFRDFVYGRALELDLTGYVRNVSQDRSVEVWAEGDRPALERLEQHLHRGPPASRVRTVNTTHPSPTGLYATFEITA